MTEPYYSDSHVQIYHGDCRDVLPTLDPVETCITDPPYGLSFMGRSWDHEVPGPEYWTLVRGAVKPGAMLLAMGGTRTWHWLAVGIEEAGWEIRDTLMWLYGSGFPKSLDVSKALDKAAGHWRGRAGAVTIEDQPSKGTEYERNPKGEPITKDAQRWDGWGTAMKPSWEPVILAMNSTDGTFADNAIAHGIAGLNIDGARIDAEKLTGWNGNPSPGYSGGLDARDERDAGGRPVDGRWPPNVILDEDAAAILDGEAGDKVHGAGHARDGYDANRGSEYDATSYHLGQNRRMHRYGDDGGPSRFFYTSKASRSERGDFNDHPTVKPLDLMAYLCRLTATPTGGTVLDPFMGSGSTLIAANRVGRKAIGIERNEHACEIAVKRIERENLDLFTTGTSEGGAIDG